MVEQHPHLANRFPGGQAKGQKAQAFATLSAFEREFVHAIHCRQVFPVFQPITDGRLMLKGIEVLSRWRRSGSVLLPDGSWMVFRIDAATPANPAEVPEAQRLGMRQQVSQAAAEQTAKAFLAELRKQHKIRVVENQL